MFDWETYNMLLYVVTNVTIKSNWSSLTELVNAIGKNDYENDNFQQTFDFHNSNKFEKIIEEDSRKIFVQNILNPKKIIDNDSKTLTIALSKGLWPLGLFYDLYSEKYNFPTLFYDNSTPSFTCSYQKIIKVELTNVNNTKNWISYNKYISKHQNLNTFYIVFYMDLYRKKKII